MGSRYWRIHLGSFSMEAWNNTLVCMGSRYQYIDCFAMDRSGLLEGKQSWEGGFVIFSFLDVVKMDGIYPWYFPMGSAHSIFLHFLRENNTISFLESPSSLLKGIGSRNLDHIEVSILLCICWELNVASSNLILGRKPCDVICVVDPLKIHKWALVS